MKKALFGTVILAIALAGCGGGGEATKAEGEGSELAQAAEGATGVAECDEYLTKVMACIDDKIPEAQRDQVKQAIEASKASWASVTDKAALANTCKAAMDQAKTAYTAMGCSF